MSFGDQRNPFQLVYKLGEILIRRYHRLHAFGKIFIWLVLLFYIALGIAVVVITPTRIAQYLYDHARLLAEMRFGWLALGAAIVFISFPPLIGHTTLVTLCGFAYGMKGFFIASSGSLVGSALVFVVLRMLFAANSASACKGSSIDHLIRISPFPPWVYSNSLFASIEAVSLWQFVVATIFVSPKLALHTFIGSRIAALSDGDQRGHMDTHTKVINGLLIAGGITIAIFTSWWVYTLVQDHIRQLDGIPADVDELAAEAIEDFDEEAPLLA
ncbi:Golgi apparatus membrane protein TVP38 [Infundibulicybe gibba]|nr:Golgi apparatus membrane protein TVP38 [Infundibulicybe gibba]